MELCAVWFTIRFSGFARVWKSSVPVRDAPEPQTESAPEPAFAVAPGALREALRLSDPEIRVLRLACEYVRNEADTEGDDDLHADVWTDVFREYRSTLVALWAAARNGGWIERRHAGNLYYGGLMYLARDLRQIPYFTVEDALTLRGVTDRLAPVVLGSAPK